MKLYIPLILLLTFPLYFFSNEFENSPLAAHEIGQPCNMPQDFSVLIEQILKNLPSSLSKEIKHLVRRVESFRCPNYIKPKKLLLVGPSGVGKTTLAKGIAFLARRPYILIRAPQLLTKFQFSGAENITQIIKSVLDLHRPFVIIVDEINALTDRFDKEQQADKESATALWLAIDECAQRDDILFIGTTNEGKKMPAPLKTRFKNHLLEIPLPDCAARKNIMNYYLKDVDHRITPDMLNRLAIKSHGLCGREIEDMMIKAIQYAFDRNPLNCKVTYRDIERALYNIRPYGRIITAMIDTWDNRKEIINELGPYMPVTSFALNILQVILSEKNAWQQNKSQEKSYILQEKSFTHQKKSHSESHELAQKSYKHAVKAHKESHKLAKKSHILQKSGNDMQRRSLEWQDFDHSIPGRLINYFFSGSWLGLIFGKK